MDCENCNKGIELVGHVVSSMPGEMGQDKQRGLKTAAYLLQCEGIKGCAQRTLNAMATLHFHDPNAVEKLDPKIMKRLEDHYLEVAMLYGKVAALAEVSEKPADARII